MKIVFYICNREGEHAATIEVDWNLPFLPSVGDTIDLESFDEKDEIPDACYGLCWEVNSFIWESKLVRCYLTNEFERERMLNNFEPEK